MRNIKIGIDVGGTFTHAVAVDVPDLEIVAKACVPTTHNSQHGVAEGVIQSMLALMENGKIDTSEVLLIAHSTTQATNALLEGDVSPVGAIILGKGIEGSIAFRQMSSDTIYLAPGKVLPVKFKYLEIDKNFTEEKINQCIDELVLQGAKVIVASQVFGPDDSEAEKNVVHLAGQKGLMSTAACNLTRLYGFKVRTRTAIVNACMLPRMIETANMTEKAIRDGGIKAPLMVMRSDGGIMGIDEMRKRPILTMLSGPAAGVAAALMYAKISDGIFLEVGGTSTDISVIKNGLPQVKSAKIGNNSLSVKTIDIRTLGVGGGSVPRWKPGKIVDVGPRSAHIANLQYAAYSESDDFKDIELEHFSPKTGDPDDYLKFRVRNMDYTITPSGASYFLGLVKDCGHGEANLNAVKNAFQAVAAKIGLKPEVLSENILDVCSNKVSRVIDALVREYKMDKEFLSLVGGGGGASAIVPFTAKKLKLPHNITQNSEVISAIGAALGMIRDTVERSILNPSEKDIIEIRNQAFESVLMMGAEPSTVEVTVEIDNANKKVIAIATGSSDLKTGKKKINLSEDELTRTAAAVLKTDEDPQLIGRTRLFSAFGHSKTKKHFFGLMKEEIQPVVLLDNEGTVKRKYPDCKCRVSKISLVKSVISEVIEDLRSFGDAGELIPDINVIVSGKIIDLSGLIQLSQILSVVDLDLKDLPGEETAIVIASRKK